MRVMREDSYLCFAEVKRGLIPAMISAYIVPQVQATVALDLFLTGRRLPAARAHQLGWISAVAATAVGSGGGGKFDSGGPSLDAAVASIVAQLRTSAPAAMARAKRLVAFETAGGATHVQNVAEAQTAFHEVMRSDEARVALQAFRDKSVKAAGGVDWVARRAAQLVQARSRL
jgi:methylglutaconyl-CoA hydratase